MLGLSSKTEVNRQFKISELLKLINADKQIRLTAKSIQSVTLTNVVTRESLNLTTLNDSTLETGYVKELFILEICLNDATIPVDFIAAFDKYINFHTIFVLRWDDQYKLYAAYKKFRNGSVQVEKYRETKWLTQLPSIKISTVISRVDEIYRSFFTLIIPYPIRESETLKEYLDRYDQILKLQREMQNLQRKVDTEMQPKKRFELNDKLKLMKSTLALLTQE